MSRLTFAEGARVAMIGDSITHSGLGVAYIQEYYRTHMPKKGVKIFNLGTGGDSAAGACARMEEILSVNPTEAVVMFGVNDMGIQYYGEKPSEGNLMARALRRRQHMEGTLRLVALLEERGIPVTLASSVGRDELTPGTAGNLTVGATDALLAMFHDNVEAIGVGRLKNTVDYLTPMQKLQGELIAHGGPSLFAPDRTHPNDLGQQIMARILLAAQGLPVTLPTAEAILDGWRERVLPADLTERRRAGLRWRDLSWVYPHQADRTPGMDLHARIAFWREELKKPDLPLYFTNMYKNYVENACHGEEYLADYLARTDALYEDGAVKENAKESLRV